MSLWQVVIVSSWIVTMTMMLSWNMRRRRGHLSSIDGLRSMQIAPIELIPTEDLARELALRNNAAVILYGRIDAGGTLQAYSLVRFPVQYREGLVNFASRKIREAEVPK